MLSIDWSSDVCSSDLIAPGQGAITFPLLDRHGELTVIEFDRDLIFPLTEAARAHGTLTVIHRDVLKVDFGELAADDGHGSDNAPAPSKPPPTGRASCRARG